ncbi:MAG TPA: PLP-dependent transferase, partial [Gemmatimonadales bacterium]|nr:PLP-dependent transferase [Gemmatimonadales bacterium]
MRIETLAVHAGHLVDPATGAVNPPIYLTTTFGRDADGTLPHGFIYARSDNPTRRELEHCLAA